MKKILLSLFTVFGVVLLSGCSLTNPTEVNDNSELNNQISLLQKQMSGLNSEIQEIKEQNENLTKENEEIKLNISTQNSGENVLMTENEELKKEIENLKEKYLLTQKNVEKYKNAFLQEKEKNKDNKTLTETNNDGDNNISYCNKEPGQQNVHPKYGNLDYLGKLFTASDCGPSALQRFGDVQNYRIDIWLNKQPSQSLIETYLSIGFNCYEGDSNNNCKSETGQKRLSLEKITTTDELLKLKQYYSYFEKDEKFSELIE